MWNALLFPGALWSTLLRTRVLKSKQRKLSITCQTQRPRLMEISIQFQSKIRTKVLGNNSYLLARESRNSVVNRCYASVLSLYVALKEKTKNLSMTWKGQKVNLLFFLKKAQSRQTMQVSLVIFHFQIVSRKKRSITSGCLVNRLSGQYAQNYARLPGYNKNNKQVLQWGQCSS